MDRKSGQIEYLQSFIKFCYADLDTARDKPFIFWAKVLNKIELKYRVYEGFDRLDELFDNWDWVVETQKDLRYGLNWVCDNIEIDWLFRMKIPYNFKKGRDLEKRDKVFVFEPNKHSIPKLSVDICAPKKDSFGDETTQTVNLSIYFIDFFKALDHFPTSSLKRCPQCDKIFFNPTNRKKIYCSYRCQNTAAVRRLRKRREK